MIDIKIFRVRRPDVQHGRYIELKARECIYDQMFQSRFSWGVKLQVLVYSCDISTFLINDVILLVPGI
jgi:hypothetical protein